MRLSATWRGDVRKEMLAEVDRLVRAVPRAIAAVAGDIKDARRAAVRASGLKGNRVPGMIRTRDYKNAGLDAASLVFVKGNKYFELWHKGGTVRARNGKYLLIPLPHVRKRLWHFQSLVISHFRGGNLGGLRGQIRVIPRKKGGFLVVLERRTKTGKIARGFVDILFVMVRTTRHKRRLDFAPGDARLANTLPDALNREMERLDRA